jgi:microcystin-dependent protein
VLGQVGGVENVTLLTTQIPAHTHTVSANTAAPTLGTPAGNLWAQGNYSASGGSAMAAGDVGNSGGSQPHPNLSPYLVVNFCIALVGIFPSRN